MRSRRIVAKTEVDVLIRRGAGKPSPLHASSAPAPRRCRSAHVRAVSARVPARSAVADTPSLSCALHRSHLRSTHGIHDKTNERRAPAPKGNKA